MAWSQPGAPTAPATVAAPRPPRVTRWLLVAVLLLHAAAAVAQPLLAGRYLSGDVDAMSAHSLNGSLLPTLCLLQLVAAVLFWRPGHGPGWPIPATAALFVAEGIQIGMGYSRNLGIHIPLGVGIVSTCIGMAIWSLAWRPRPSRRASAPFDPPRSYARPPGQPVPYAPPPGQPVSAAPPPGQPMSYASPPRSHPSSPGEPWP